MVAARLGTTATGDGLVPMHDPAFGPGVVGGAAEVVHASASSPLLCGYDEPDTLR